MNSDMFTTRTSLLTITNTRNMWHWDGAKNRNLDFPR